MEQFFASWGNLSAGGAILIIALSYFVALNRGTLWTGKQHQESMAQKDEIIGIYKASDAKKDVALTEQIRQNGILVSQLEAFGHFIKDADRVRAQAPSTGDSGNAEGSSYVRT